jgi:GNAT superfamily N-acetyltransferase
VKIEPAGPQDPDTVRALFREYEAMLGEDLCFQGFEQELAGLPGKYAPPAGRLFIAREQGEAAGCVALRAVSPRVCEMKRLFVRPNFRGRGLGRALAVRIIEEARVAGYASMLLDTLERLNAARELYRSLRFEEVAPYYQNPLPGVVYLKLDLGCNLIRALR